MYEFSVGLFFFGFVLLLIGATIIIFHQKLADNIGNGVSSYDRFKMWGLIICGIAIILMTGLHSILLNWLAGSLFGA